MLLSSVLGATTVLVFACAAQVSQPSPRDVPALQGSSSEQPSEGAADLRVALAPIAFGAVAEPFSTEPSTEPPSTESAAGHSSEVLHATVLGYQEALQSCAPGISGAADADAEAEAASSEFTLFIELDEAGYVLGGSTNPSPGQEGVSAIAGCALAQARSWLFPARSRRGRTILIVPFVVAGIR